MKRISHTSRCKEKLLHIETDLAIVNIRIGLHDRRGRKVESIEITPDRYAGEPMVFLSGKRNTVLTQLRTEAKGEDFHRLEKIVKMFKGIIGRRK